MRLLMLLSVMVIVGCSPNRRSEEPEPGAADTSGGRTLKAPGDSVRLEDTLSAPPPSADSVPSQR
jgi:hypothetical protein